MKERQLILEKLEEYGFDTDHVQFPDDFEDNGRMHTIYYCEDYPTAGLGVISPMFKKLDVKVRAGVHTKNNNNNIILRIRYDYKHYCGSNGHTAEFEYNQKTKTWEQSE